MLHLTYIEIEMVTIPGISVLCQSRCNITYFLQDFVYKKANQWKNKIIIDTQICPFFSP